MKIQTTAAAGGVGEAVAITCTMDNGHVEQDKQYMYIFICICVPSLWTNEFWSNEFLLNNAYSAAKKKQNYIDIANKDKKTDCINQFSSLACI